MAVVLDTDVVSYLYKRDTRAEPYRPHLNDPPFIISFMSLAECVVGRSNVTGAKQDNKVEWGEVELIPGDEALARVRNLLAQHLPSGVGIA